MAAASHRVASVVPDRSGIGLRAQHYQELITEQPDIGWIEAHSENYFGNGGAPLYYLEKARELYPLSLHGVGLSIGSTDPVNETHLEKLKKLIARFEPGLVSEHLSWSSVSNIYSNDLMPLPYTEESLRHIIDRVVQVQDALGRRILMENPSSYLRFIESEIPEAEFLALVAQGSGCGVLLDVNNVYVSSVNHKFNPRPYIEAIPGELVDEIHLAGYTVNTYDGKDILIDAHNHPVHAEVWALYKWTIANIGPKPTLIEWDADIPDLSILTGEARKAQSVLNGHST